MATTPFELGQQAAAGNLPAVQAQKQQGVVKSRPAKPLARLNKSIKGEVTGAPVHYGGPERSPGNAYSPYAHNVQGNVKDVKAWQDRMAPGEQQNIAINHRTGQAISNAPAHVIQPSGRDPDEVQAQLTADYDHKSKARQAEMGTMRSNMDARSALADEVAAGRQPASALLNMRAQQRAGTAAQASSVKAPATQPAAPPAAQSAAPQPGAAKTPAELDMIPQGEQKFTKAPDPWDASIEKNIRDPKRPALTTEGIPSKGVPFGAMADTERGMKEWNKPRALTGDSTIDRLTNPNYMKTRPDHVQRINEETQQKLESIRGSKAVGPDMQQLLGRRAADPAREADIAEARRRHREPNAPVKPLTMADKWDMAHGQSWRLPAQQAPLGAAGKAEAARLVRQDTAWADKREQINREAAEAEIKGHADRVWKQHTRNDTPLDYQTRLTFNARGDQRGKLEAAAKPKPGDLKPLPAFRRSALTASNPFTGARQFMTSGLKVDAGQAAHFNAARGVGPGGAGDRISRVQHNQELLHASPEARKFQETQPEKYLQITGRLSPDRTKALRDVSAHKYESMRAPAVAAQQREGLPGLGRSVWNAVRPGNWGYVTRADGSRAGLLPAPQPIRRMMQTTRDFWTNPVDAARAHFETGPVMSAAQEFGRQVGRASGRG